nr:expressed protein [Hymenolepis microstoma]
MPARNGTDRSIIYSFSYPVYQLKAIAPDILLTAGGGGNPRTGIPNRIDVIQFDRPAYAPATIDSDEALIPVNTTVVGGINTQNEAIMHMALGSQSPGAASILTLEKSTCQEYLIHANHLEPSTIADQISTDEECAITSSKLAYQTHKYSSSNSSTDDSYNGITGVSSTTVKRKNIQPKKSAADSSGEDQLPWSCEKLRNVRVAPTKTLFERRRLDSCSSTGDVYPVKDEEDELTCIASGGPVGWDGAWCAVGTVHGGVALFDRFTLADKAYDPKSLASAYGSYAFTFDGDVKDTLLPLRPFCTLPDASGGRCAPVCDVALSATTYGASTTSLKALGGETAKFQHAPTVPLLATISGRPRGSLLCIWRLPQSSTPEATIITAERHVKFGVGTNNEEATALSPMLYAEVKMENAHVDADSKKHPNRSENGTRFRHCEFLRWIHRRPTGVTPLANEQDGSGLFTFLVTTEQPVSPTTRSVCHLSVWLVPLPSSSTHTQTVPQSVLGLERFAAVPLPPGEIPACIAVHPSAHRGIIALGTMEGSVEVYMISLHDHSLVCVYSRPKAHQLFVTSLAFLPPRERHSQKRQEGSEAKLSLLPAHYELVSSSANRVIRWHKGPSLETIAQIGARAYQPSFRSQLLRNIFLLLLLLFIIAFPILISLPLFTLTSHLAVASTSQRSFFKDVQHLYQYFDSSTDGQAAVESVDDMSVCNPHCPKTG